LIVKRVSSSKKQEAGPGFCWRHFYNG
jgi:hypothetical protein